MKSEVEDMSRGFPGFWQYPMKHRAELEGHGIHSMRAGASKNATISRMIVVLNESNITTISCNVVLVHRVMMQTGIMWAC